MDPIVVASSPFVTIFHSEQVSVDPHIVHQRLGRFDERDEMADEILPVREQAVDME